MFDHATTKQLQDEINRRSRAVIEDGKPNQITDKNFGTVIEMCQDYLDQVTNKGWVDDDLKEYIFEGAMCAVFGDEVWAFINSRRT